ncbi:hypothetical protein TacPo2_75 [Pantoea bacteriophage TacPo2]
MLEDLIRQYDLSTMSPDEKIELLELIQMREEYIRYNALDAFKPYKFQTDFYAAGRMYKRRFLCAANRIGKSFSEAQEVSQHLTGVYKDWWTGHRFEKPILAWCVGITGESTQKVLQKELFGTADVRDTKAIGTGAIPKKFIDFDSLAKDGQRIVSCRIKHFDEKGRQDGYSTVEFRSTQQGEHVLMGATVDYIWIDEEDPYRSMQIYAQCVTRTATTAGLVTITATPENGLTELVKKFMNDASGALYWQNATWDDAPHLSEETKKELLASIPEWQHDMRSKGLPILGSGLVYPVSEESIKVEPFKIPDHWPRVCGVDIGINHDTAASWAAYDVDTDTIYIYDHYAAAEGIPAIHAHAINQRGHWIPVVLPHDADNVERGSGRSVAMYYREAGVNVMPDTFHNPIGFDGKKNNFVEPGIMEILQRMKTGRFKIFNTCHKIFEEMRSYQRKEGKIKKVEDDSVDAMRYAALSVTHRGISENVGINGNLSYNDNWNNFNNAY